MNMRLALTLFQAQELAKMWEEEEEKARLTLRSSLTKYYDDVVKTTDRAYISSKRLENTKRKLWFA